MTDNVRTLKLQNGQPLENDPRTSQLGEIIDIPYGLTIVVMDKQELMPIIRTTFAQLAQLGSRKFGIGIPRGSQVISVCFGERHARQMEPLFAANTFAKNPAPHKIKNLELNRPICWTSSESVVVIRSLMAGSDSWLMLEQATTPIVSVVGSIGVLLSIGEMAKKARSRIMLFIVLPEGGEKCQLDQCCDEYIAVNSCEPDFGFASAFSVDVASRRYLNGVGIVKTMCCVKYVNGVFKRRYAPFVSEQLENRVIWALRSQGSTLDEIAGMMKINKSTVLRRLQAMPYVRQITGCEELISHYLNAPPTAKAPSEAVRSRASITISDKNDANG